MSLTKFEILKAKMKRIVEEKDESKMDFLKIMACHKGSVMPDSITVSFKRYKEKYGDQRFEQVKNYFLDEGIISIPGGSYQPIQFSVKNEKGDYDHQCGEDLSRFFGELIFKHEGKIKETIDALLKEPEGKEFLTFVAKEKGIHIYDGIEPKIKETIGKQSYERILSKFLELEILNEYAWSSRRHAYAGYKLLPYIDNYIKFKLGIFELEENEKTVLTFIASLNKIFDDPRTWYVWFNYPTEYHYKTIGTCALACKFVGFLINRTEEDVKKIIEDLQSKGLIKQADLGYTKAGLHRGIVLQPSKSGQVLASKEENELIKKVENKIKEIFSKRDSRIVYYLYSQEGVPLRILSLINGDSVDALKRTGLIGEENGLFLRFKKDSPIEQYIFSGIEPETARKWLKEKCESILSKEEKLFLGFLSTCKNVILDKQPDWTAWNRVTSRTQRRYEAAFADVIPNFGYLKKLFSFITNLLIDETERIATNLEKNGFLVRKRSYCGFPGYITIYWIPIKFDFEFDFSPLNSKIKNYIDFLSGNFEQNHNQIIFLDYLTEFYDEDNFMVKAPKVKDLLEFLNHDPPKQYLPVYFLEDGNVILHPSVQKYLKQEISKLKSKIIEPIKTLILDACQKYCDNVLYNCKECPTKDYYILHIETPDPSTGIVSFVVAPWVYVTDQKKIYKLCERSNTVNLFVIYPNYPQLRRVLTEASGNYNLFIYRKGEVYTLIKRLDLVSESLMVQLSKQTKITEIEKLQPEEGQEIGIGVIDEIPIAIGQMNKAENTIEKWFKKLKGNVIAMLDFIDKTTFGYLDSIPKECGIQIITSNIKEKDKCRSKAKKTARDRPFFEIMEIDKVHERWIGSEESFIIEIGTDLKRDALGHTNHTIRVLKPKAYKKTIKRFYEFWNKSQKELQRLYGSRLVKNLFFSNKK